MLLESRPVIPAERPVRTVSLRGASTIDLGEDLADDLRDLVGWEHLATLVVRDLGGEVAPHLRDAIAQGRVKGPRIFAAGRSIATTGGHADPTHNLSHFLSEKVGHPGPEQGVIDSPEEGRQAVRQRY